MSSVKFDPTINLGHILSTLTAIGAIVGVYVAVRLEVNTVTVKVAGIERTLDGLGRVLEINARQDQRLDDISRRLDRIETK